MDINKTRKHLGLNIIWLMQTEKTKYVDISYIHTLFVSCLK